MHTRHRRPGGPGLSPTPGDGPKGRAWGQDDVMQMSLVEAMLGREDIPVLFFRVDFDAG